MATTHTQSIEVYSERWIVTTIVDGDTLTQTAKRESDGSPLRDTYTREPMVLDYVSDESSSFTTEEALAYYTVEAPHAIFSHAGW